MLLLVRFSVEKIVEFFWQFRKSIQNSSLANAEWFLLEAVSPYLSEKILWKMSFRRAIRASAGSRTDFATFPQFPMNVW